MMTKDHIDYLNRNSFKRGYIGVDETAYEIYYVFISDSWIQCYSRGGYNFLTGYKNLINLSEYNSILRTCND
jgi:hypothetical protein